MLRRLMKNQLGFTLLEMIVVIIVISTIGYIALGYYQKLQVDVERTKVQRDVGIMRSAIGMQVADYIVAGEMHSLEELVGSDPFLLLDEWPENYLGAYPEDNSAELEKGHWVFAEDEGALIYIVRNAAYCDTKLTTPKRIKFKVSPIIDDKGETGTKIVGLTLKAITPYRWRTPWD